MFFFIVLTPIYTTSGLWSTDNTRKYHQIDVYIYQCGNAEVGLCSVNVVFPGHTRLLIEKDRMGEKSLISFSK